MGECGGSSGEPCGHWRGGQAMTDTLAKLEEALRRGEQAARRLGDRHRRLQAAARQTLHDLDALIDEERRTSGHG